MKKGEVAVKVLRVLSILLVASVLVSCVSAPNASNVKGPDAEINGCTMPNGTITDLYMFKVQNDGARYSWVVLNDLMQNYHNPVEENLSSADKKAFYNFKPIDKPLVFQNKYSAAELGDLANYMHENGYAAGFWHEIKGDHLVVISVWSSDQKDYMYREVACFNKINLSIASLEEKIKAVNEKMQQSQGQLVWVQAIDRYNNRARLMPGTVTAGRYGVNAGRNEIVYNKPIYVVDYVFAGGSAGLSDKEGNNISSAYVEYEPWVHRFKTFEQ